MNLQLLFEFVQLAIFVTNRVNMLGGALGLRYYFHFHVNMIILAAKCMCSGKKKQSNFGSKMSDNLKLCYMYFKNVLFYHILKQMPNETNMNLLCSFLLILLLVITVA